MRKTYTFDLDNRKIALIDKAFQAITIEELEVLLGEQILVGKLRNNVGPCIIRDMIDDNTENCSTIIQLRRELSSVHGELATLRSDMGTLVRAVADIGQHDGDFTNLKYKYGSY